MKVRLAGVLALALILALTVTTAFAASVHFKPKSPRFIDQGVVLLAQGSLAGLGNGDVLVTLTATALPSTTCTNRGGGLAPGQNPAAVTVTGSEAIPASEIQNGQVYISLQTNPPPQPTWDQAGCPNSNWTAEIVDLTFTSARITVTQAGVLVLDQTFKL